MQSLIECPSIMHDVRIGSNNEILVKPVVDYDWYVTGYCISSHFDLKWGLSIHKVIEEDTIDLLVQGIRYSPVAIGSIREMKTSVTDLSISQNFNKLKEFCQLESLELGIYSFSIEEDELLQLRLEWNISSCPTEKDNAQVMQQLIEPGSSLRSLAFWGSPTLIPILLAQSSLEELTDNKKSLLCKTWPPPSRKHKPKETCNYT